MKCPQCGAALQRRALEMGSAYVCGRCGWGRDTADARRQSEASVTGETVKISAKTWIKLPIFWALTFLICLGPYLGIVHGIPWLVEQQGWDIAELTPETLRQKINPGYWFVLLVYVVIAALLNIGVDFENLGLFGTTRDNPFSLEDDRNRTLLKLAMFLAPGKIVAFTLIGTIRVFMALMGVGSRD
jgi:hypothetical protein